MTWSVKSIHFNSVAAVWHIVAPMLAEAVELSEGRYDMRAVYDDLQSERSLLWVIYDETKVVQAAFTARKAVYPRASFLTVEFLGGADMALWVEECDRVLTAYATDCGLDGLELVGRKGWSRPLRSFGWRENAVMLVKPFAAAHEEKAA